MVTAIIVALITLVVAVIAVLVFFALRYRRTNASAHTKRPGKSRVASIGNVRTAVSYDDPDSPYGETTARSAVSDSSTGRVSEGVRSRFMALGVLAAAIFGSLTVKLWSMQVLMSDRYKAEATINKFTTVSTPAPRGYIYDANGIALVSNQTTLTVLAESTVIDDRDVMQRLSTVLGLPYNIVRARIMNTASGAQSQRVVVRDARLRDVAFIAEHSDAFPGVSVQQRTVRNYPFGALAAHVLGYTGSVSQQDLENIPENRTVTLGDTIGKSGIEAFYDNLLAGEHGQRRVIADSQGRVVEVESETPALQGSDVYLTLWAPVQYVAETQLAKLIAPENIIGKGTGVAGAIVAMDVTDGSIIAMASYPTFDPSTFTGGISQEIWDLYSQESSYYPLLNRAISGAYPAASTYKAFTGLAGLKYGFADDKKTWDCEGWWDGYESGDVQMCWKHSGHGEVTFHEGIVESCDIVFYETGKAFFYAGTSMGGKYSDTAMQEEIAKFGFGQATGIDLNGEEVGRIPTPEWKASHWSDVPTEGQWRGGDLTNLVIGQGDVLVTPLQMAVAYGGIATGNLMKPHLLKEVRNGVDQAAAITFTPEVVSVPDVDPNYLNQVRSALREVAGHATGVVAVFDEHDLDVDTVSAKTGTGEVAGKGDMAWFVCYYPSDAPKYVVATCIEQGGGGAAVAGPVGAEVMCAIIEAADGRLNTVGRIAGSSGKSVEYHGDASERTD